MSVVVGIDIGGSTTKIVGFEKKGDGTKRLIDPIFVRATDPITSLYGAFGKFTFENSLSLSDIEKVMMTGVGASYINGSVYSLKCESVPEFNGIGLGGLYLSGLERALVVSMGTGTAMVYAEQGKPMEYLGGTGVGGGSLVGLSRLLLNMEDIDHIQDLAQSGDLSKIDLRIGDISKKNADLNAEMTAANFGKISDIATKSDIALGVINMVFETIAMIARFAAQSKGVRDIVLTGNLATVKYAKELFPRLSEMFDINFIIPPNAQFSTVIGTAICG